MAIRGWMAGFSAAALATALIGSQALFVSDAAAQAAGAGGKAGPQGNIGAGAGNAPAGGAIGGNEGAGNLAAADAPVAIPAPAGGGNILALVTGVVKDVNAQQRTLTLENGDTYTLATNMELDKIAPGQVINMTLNVTADEKKVVHMMPANTAEEAYN